MRGGGEKDSSVSLMAALSHITVKWRHLPGQDTKWGNMDVILFGCMSVRGVRMQWGWGLIQNVILNTTHPPLVF